MMVCYFSLNDESAFMITSHSFPKYICVCAIVLIVFITQVQKSWAGIIFKHLIVSQQYYDMQLKTKVIMTCTILIVSRMIYNYVIISNSIVYQIL